MTTSVAGATFVRDALADAGPWINTLKPQSRARRVNPRPVRAATVVRSPSRFRGSTLTTKLPLGLYMGDKVLGI